MISKLQEQNLKAEKGFRQKRDEEKRLIETQMLELSKKFNVLVSAHEYEWYKQEMMKTRDMLREKGERSAGMFKDQFTYSIFMAENNAVINFINQLLDSPRLIEERVKDVKK